MVHRLRLCIKGQTLQKRTDQNQDVSTSTALPVKRQARAQVRGSVNAHSSHPRYARAESMRQSPHHIEQQVQDKSTIKASLSAIAVNVISLQHTYPTDCTKYIRDEDTNVLQTHKCTNGRLHTHNKANASTLKRSLQRNRP